MILLSWFILQVMELMEGGDLRNALWQNREKYAWERRGGQVLGPRCCVRALPSSLVILGIRNQRSCVQVALDIARGLHFLHSSGVIHRYRMPMWSCVQRGAFPIQ